MEEREYVKRYLEKLGESFVVEGEPTHFESCSELLAIVVVTSAVPSNPSTEMISKVVESYFKKEPLLEGCEKVLVCDAPKVTTGETKWKKGQVKESAAAAYAEYVDRLEGLIQEKVWPFAGFRLIRMERFGGFGFSLRRGLEVLSKRFVLVIQHDRALRLGFEADDLLRTMLEHRKINYIGLASNSSVGAKARYRGMGFDCEQTSTKNGRNMVQLPFLYDSTHIARVEWYLNFVFGWHVFPDTQYGKPFRLKTGDFPEDKLGTGILCFCRAKGMEVHEKFGTFLLDDGKSEYVRHYHGRKLGTCEARDLEKYVTPPTVEQRGGGGGGGGGREGTRTDDAQSSEDDADVFDE